MPRALFGVGVQLYTSGMDSSHLNQKQVDALLAQVRWITRYLRRLIERMNARGFPTNDPLRLRVMLAMVAVGVLDELVRQLGERQKQKIDHALAARSKREYNRRLRDERNG